METWRCDKNAVVVNKFLVKILEILAASQRIKAPSTPKNYTVKFGSQNSFLNSFLLRIL